MSNNQVIPDEAVEAARRELAKGCYQMSPNELPYADAARRALEAAAPHMLAAAWFEGRWAGILNATKSTNPYRAAGYVTGGRERSES
jgi:hypothetical protein